MVISQGDLERWLPEVCKIARKAGKVILDIYQNEDYQIEKKVDGTPVTLADKLADNVIFEELSKLTPEIPLVSEESIDEVDFSARKDWQTFWMVDPLDGTKEFIERTGEFCVNIALVDRGKSILGVVYAPMLDVSYAAYSGGEAYKLDSSGRHIIKANTTLEDPVRVTVSRRHGRRVDDFIAQFSGSKPVLMGSAIKSCLVAEGKADVYPRFGPTSHWDTAAIQIIVEVAGGAVLNFAGESLSYLPTEDLLNPFFIVVGDRSVDWVELCKIT